MNGSDFHQDDEHTDGAVQWNLWKQLLRYAAAYPRELSLLAMCAVITAGMEISFPLITRAVIDTVAANVDEDAARYLKNDELLFYALLYALTTIVIALSIGGFIRVSGLLESRISHDIRRDGFINLQALSFSYFNHRPVGWLMARMTADCDRLSSILVWGLVDTIWGLTLMLGIGIAMFVLDVTLSLVVLSILPVLAVASVFFQRRLLKSARAATGINSQITASYNEAITGVLTSKVFLREQSHSTEFGELTQRLSRAKVQNLTYASIYLPVVVTLASLAIGLTLVVGGHNVLSGVISVGTLIAFVRFATNLFEPVQEISSRFAEMQMAQASAERILGLINTVPGIKDAESLVDGQLPTDHCIQNITLTNVSFAYEHASESTKTSPILNGINLQAHLGQTIAIVGPTGGGKSTLVNVIARFYEPVEGEILIDGVDYRQRGLHWLQSRLGIILQDNHIFSGSLMSNIRYGNLDASDEDVYDASRVAGAHDFIMAMPDEYHSEVGERGERLSAGQKQLVSFARAIVSNPQILIMDEATSSVDTETEQQIQDGLESMLKGRIAFIIAHRLSTIRQADHIVFIDKGRIVEQGSHEELMTANGRYKGLYQLQQVQQSTAQLAKESIYDGGAQSE